ncbi:pyruvate formate lyase family protein, partial [Myxococcota bacterium]
ALMLKATDHLPMVVNAGSRIFGGSSGNQVITLGGLTAEGGTAVCDMTWIFLKATEMLRLRDPNVNARFAPGVNSEAYLRRLCEVNLITGSTPSLHNDAAVVPALEEQGFGPADARDWTATGCVEPTSCGRHYGHTNCMMFNMVAPLEMALYDGVHPLIGEQVGPHTGDPTRFATYEDFLGAYQEQLGWLIDTSVEANEILGRSHQACKPTPLLSALFTGPMESGKDLIEGGAQYNSSGTAMVGLTDVIDSLAALKLLVYDRRRVDLATFLDALRNDFEGHERLHAEIMSQVPKFGQDPGLGADDGCGVGAGATNLGDADRVTADLPNEIARDLMTFIYDRWQSHVNYRGGKYVPGYWSMSYHVAFGSLTGALPSGRKRGKAFTPGLTPSHVSGASLTDQISTVAALNPLAMPNNIAFNVKVVPGADDTHQAILDRMAAYVGAYFELGGMQMQFNVVSSETMRQAMVEPDEFRDLMVRISGYNVYFVELDRDIQLELIERTEHALGG